MTDIAALISETRAYPSDVSQWDEPGLAGEVIARLIEALEGTHWECNCVPNLGPSHCHACTKITGRGMPWGEAHPFPASTTGSEQP